VKDVADLVSSNQQHVAARKNDLLGTMADTCRAKQLLNFEARYDFVETMKKMIADAKSGSADYLAKMWHDPHTVSVVEQKLPGWSGLPPLERSGRIKEALISDPTFVDGILKTIRAREHTDR